jgi:hypothetical protein
MEHKLGDLVILPKGARINQTWYTELVLKPYFVPFYKKMQRKYGPKVVMQEDGAKYHFTPVAARYKNSQKVRYMP